MAGNSGSERNDGQIPNSGDQIAMYLEQHPRELKIAAFGGTPVLATFASELIAQVPHDAEFLAEVAKFSQDFTVFSNNPPAHFFMQTSRDLIDQAKEKALQANIPEDKYNFLAEKVRQFQDLSKIIGSVVTASQNRALIIDPDFLSRNPADVTHYKKTASQLSQLAAVEINRFLNKSQDQLDPNLAPLIETGILLLKRKDAIEYTASILGVNLDYANKVNRVLSKFLSKIISLGLRRGQSEQTKQGYNDIVLLLAQAQYVADGPFLPEGDPDRQSILAMIFMKQIIAQNRTSQQL